MRIAQHFELDQGVIVEEFARQPQRAHRIVGAVAACGVGQQRESRGRHGLEQAWLIGILADVGAPDRDRDDLGPARIDRQSGLLEIAVFACAQQQS